jgi:hypothetical protein
MEYLDKEEEKQKHTAIEKEGKAMPSRKTLKDVLTNFRTDYPEFAKKMGLQEEKTVPQEQVAEEETQLSETPETISCQEDKKQPDTVLHVSSTEAPQPEQSLVAQQKEKTPSGSETPAAAGHAGEEQKAEIETLAVSTESPHAYIQSLSTAKPTSFVKEMQNASGVLTTIHQQDKQDLVASLPSLEQPTGLPLKGSESLQEEADADYKAEHIEKVKPSPEKEKKEIPVEHKQPDYKPIVAPPPAVKGEEDPDIESKVKAALFRLPITDEGVNTSAGVVPAVSLTGPADPNQNEQSLVQANLDVEQSRLQSEEESKQDRGEHDIYPDVETALLEGSRELSAAEVHAAGEAKNIPSMDEQTRRAFDEQTQSLFDEKIQQEISKSEQAHTKREQDSEEARIKNQDQIDTETEATRLQQEEEQANAKQSVTQHRSEWQQENEQIKEEYANESDENKEEYGGLISKETETAHAQAEAQYSKAEQEADQEKSKKEQEAGKMKAEATQKKKGFWARLAGAVSDFFNKLKEGLNSLFNALRKAVKFIIEKAKQAVSYLIDKARNAIIGLIRAFGEVLKKLVNVVLAKFPALAAKINALIDKAVDAACAVVNALADALKKTILLLLDALGAALDLILAAYQALYNLILDALEFLVVGLIKIMEGIANLVSSARQSPEHFLPQLSEELLGQDITQPLPNERPAPSVEKEHVQEAAREGEIEQQDANVLSKSKYTSEDFVVEPVANNLELSEELLAQLVALGDGQALEFGHNNDPENDIEAVKESALTGEGKESASMDIEDPLADQAQEEPVAEEAGQELVGPFSSAAERGKYLVGQMMDGIKKWWNENQIKIILALGAVIVGVILANIVTGGALMAALPILMQVVSAYFVADTIINLTKHFGSYLKEAWPGELAKGAASLARGLAIGAMELVMALLFGGKAFLKGAKNMAKTAQKGGVKGLAKMGKTAAQKEAKALVRNARKVQVKAIRQGRNVVRQGKIVYGGVRNGVTKGAKSLDDLGKRLGKQFRFRKFKIEVQKRRFRLLGEVNPWVLLASGEVKYVDQSDLTRRRAGKLGDSVIYKPIGEKGQRAIVIGEKRIGGSKGSVYVERLNGDKDVASDTFNDLFAVENNAVRKKIITGDSGKTFEELEKEYGFKIASTISDRGKLASSITSKKPQLISGYDDLNAHHIIPVEAIEKSRLLREAISQGFDFNGLTNGIWLRRYSSVNRVHPKTNKIIASPDGVHASHDAYSEQIIESIRLLEETSDSLKNAKVIMENYTQKIREKIDLLNAENAQRMIEGEEIVLLNNLFK